jgi:hypothetical protein
MYLVDKKQPKCYSNFKPYIVYICIANGDSFKDVMSQNISLILVIKELVTSRHYNIILENSDNISVSRFLLDNKYYHV